MWVYPEIRTVDDIADYYARHQPERLALSYQGRETSFGALNTIASAVANALASAGVPELTPEQFEVRFSLHQAAAWAYQNLPLGVRAGALVLKAAT